MDPIPPATTPDPATIVYDEREELLREAAALGNSKAVTHYLQAGVNANGRNKINGWTSLHWAASRGHLPIVHLLLRHGADPSVLNFKKQTALDLTKSDQVKECLAQRTPTAAVVADVNAPPTAAKRKEVDPQATKLAITPNYLREPDLLKTWSSPDELPSQLKPTVLTEADRPAAHTPSHPATTTLPAATPTAPSSHINNPAAQAPAHSAASHSTQFSRSSPNLIRIAVATVAKGFVTSASSSPSVQPYLAGHVLSPPSATLGDLVKQIQDELLQDDNSCALAHLPEASSGSGGRHVSRLLMQLPKSHMAIDGLMPVPKAQWTKYTVGEVVPTEVKEDGCAWAALVAEIDV